MNMDRHMAQNLDRWLTTPPEDRWDESGVFRCTECLATYPTFEEAAACHWGVGGVEGEELEVNRCQVCGEQFKLDDEIAEMAMTRPPVNDDERERFYDHLDQPIGVLCHAQCGLSAGMEVA